MIRKSHREAQWLGEASLPDKTPEYLPGRSQGQWESGTWNSEWSVCKGCEGHGIPSGGCANVPKDMEFRVASVQKPGQTRNGGCTKVGRDPVFGVEGVSGLKAGPRWLQLRQGSGCWSRRHSHESGERRDSSARVGVASADGVRGFCALWGARRFPL